MSEEIIESRVSRLLFGGFSCAAALFITHPLDVIKLNLQVKSLTIRELIRYHYATKKDLRIRSIYKGIPGSMARTMIYSNLRFEIYELARRQNLLNSFQGKVAAASIGGGIGGFLVTPIYKVHVRMQNDELLPTSERRYYKGLLHGLYHIYSKEGLRLMFAGAGISTFRGMMATIGQLAFYDEVKLILLKYPEYFKDDFKTYLVASISAGFGATFLQQPFEVVNVKLIDAPPDKFKNSGDVLRYILHFYGIRGFFKGLVPGFLRIVPQTVITYMILESLRMHCGVLHIERKRGDAIEVISMTD